MMTATQCPTAERLRAFSLGRLPDDENDELFEHLRTCQSCQAELETVDDAEDSLISELRVADDHPGLTDEPQCKRALAKALGALAAADELSDTGILDMPRTIGEYQVVRLLGRGGMGKVMLARHTKLGRQVAVKFLAGHRLADPRMRERFEAEMRAIGQLSHPNIVTAHDAREVDGTAVLVTEYIDGFDLGELVAKTGPLSIANACEITRKVAAALQYTGDQGFVHRDVKPSNVMVSRGGEVKLLDLGLARYQSGHYQSAQRTELTGTGQAIGTADYVSPEQVTDGRDVDSRADIYSLGCTMFKLLTGNAPFDDQSHQTAFAKMTAQVSETPPSLADRMQDCPSGLVRLVDSMLAKDPAKRPQSVGEIAASLATWSRGHDLSELVAAAAASEAQTRPLPLSTTTRTQPWHRRPVSIRVAIAAGFLGALVGLLLGMFIKITYPDGTVVLLPIGDAKVESVDDGVAAGSSAADASGAGQNAAGAAAAVPDESPKRLSIAERMAAAGPNADLKKLQGIWSLDRPNSETPSDLAAVVVAFEDTDFMSVAIRDKFPPEFTYGTIDRMQRDGGGLWMHLKSHGPDKSMGVRVKFDENQCVTFGFDPFAQNMTGPFQATPIHSGVRGAHDLRLKRLGDFPTTPDQMKALLGDPPMDPSSPTLKAVGMILQAKMMGPGQFTVASAKARESVQSSTSKNNLRQIVIAFHNFHDAYRKFPGTSNLQEGSGNSHGKPIQPFSWRVAILPFIEQAALFERYHFDEPWDSETNLKLLAEMPEIYRSPRADGDQPIGHTNYLGYATEHSALGTDGGVAMREFRDGTSNTLLLIETKDSVPWTKPEDLSGDAEFFEPLVYAMADGSVQEADKLDPELLKKMITRDGGEVIPR